MALSIPNGTRHWALVLDQGLPRKPTAKLLLILTVLRLICSAEDRRMVHQALGASNVSLLFLHFLEGRSNLARPIKNPLH